MNTNTSKAKYSPVKLFASFNRNIFIPLIEPNNTPDIIYNRLKQAGVRISKDKIADLMAGKEQLIKDFEIVTVVDHQVSGVNQIPSEPKYKTSPAEHKARGSGRQYEPQGEVKPLKHGTVYAMLFEMIKPGSGGATIEELASATGNDTLGGVTVFLTEQVKLKGYGVRYDQNTRKYHLVMPKGQKALIYK